MPEDPPELGRQRGVRFSPPSSQDVLCGGMDGFGHGCEGQELQLQAFPT